MSKFSSYAARANAIAKDALDQIKAAEDALEAAERYREETRVPNSGMVDAERLAQAARVEADFQEARATHDRILRELPYATKNKLAAIRQELSDALSGEFDARPSEIDSQTLELLRSGVLRAEEYARLSNKYKKEGNTTMCRLVAHHSGIAAEKMAERFGENDSRAQMLRAVAVDGEGDGESAVADKLAAFDVIGEAFDSSARNTAMIGDWDGLTGPVVENF